MNGNVGIQFDCDCKLITDNKPCSFSMNYRSIIGSGKASRVDTYEEKKHALSIIMEHYTSKYDWSLNDRMINSVDVFCIECENVSAKQHL